MIQAQLQMPGSAPIPHIDSAFCQFDVRRFALVGAGEQYVAEYIDLTEVEQVTVDNATVIQQQFNRQGSGCAGIDGVDPGAQGSAVMDL